MRRNGEDRKLASLRTKDPKEPVSTGRIVFNVSFKDWSRGIKRVFKSMINVGVQSRMTRICFQKAKRLFNLRQFLRRQTRRNDLAPRR